MVRVLCTALNGESGPHFGMLQDAGHECCVVDRRLNLWDPAVLISAVKDFDAVIAGSEPWPADVIAAVPRVRVLARAGVDVCFVARGANLEALQAVLREVEAGGAIDAVWCLGDTVGYASEPHEIELQVDH